MHTAESSSPPSSYCQMAISPLQTDTNNIMEYFLPSDVINTGTFFPSSDTTDAGTIFPRDSTIAGIFFLPVTPQTTIPYVCTNFKLSRLLQYNTKYYFSACHKHYRPYTTTGPVPGGTVCRFRPGSWIALSHQWL